MPRYIETEAFEKDVRKRYCKPCEQDGRDHHGIKCRACDVDDMLGEVADAPTADVREVTHGHWFISWDGEIICSVCRKHNPVRLMQNFPFCPYCGAEMDEEEEHEKVSFEEDK